VSTSRPIVCCCRCCLFVVVVVVLVVVAEGRQVCCRRAVGVWRHREEQVAPVNIEARGLRFIMDAANLRPPTCQSIFVSGGCGVFCSPRPNNHGDEDLVAGFKMDGVVGNVVLSNEAWAGCLQHALSTESEEIMGLILGEYWVDGRPITSSQISASPQQSAQTGDASSEKSLVNGKSSTTILMYAFHTLIRSDRRADRVEVSPMQLSEGLSAAEKLAKKFGRPLRVVGWYHSHPHITVLPSHVDLRTQNSWQGLDRRFVGLIFSVFSSDAASGSSNSGASEMKTVAFQATPDGVGGLQQRIVPLAIRTPEEMQLNITRSLLFAQSFESLTTFYEKVKLKIAPLTCSAHVNWTQHIVLFLLLRVVI